MTAASVLRSYAPDWILTIVLWQVVATTQAFVRRNLDPTHFGCLRATLALLSRTAGHKREFSLTDITIQHSFAEHERVPPLSAVSHHLLQKTSSSNLQTPRYRLSWNTFSRPASSQLAGLEKQMGCS